MISNFSYCRSNVLIIFSILRHETHTKYTVHDSITNGDGLTFSLLFFMLEMLREVIGISFSQCERHKYDDRLHLNCCWL